MPAAAADEDADAWIKREGGRTVAVAAAAKEEEAEDEDAESNTAVES